MGMPLPLDVVFFGRPGVIAAGVVECSAGHVLVDPGPASSLDGLTAALHARGLGLADVDALLLTHIHLDHSGATGSILRAHPRVRVFVHERGAPHLIDPSKLLVSAGRLYGDQMERLWGEVLPVPAGNVTVLRGGESLRVAGDRFDVAYTPGHASHHVSYFHEGSGTAFVGDTGGIRIAGVPFVMAPTPPPDIDLDAWHESIDRIAAWKPASLFLTHFGAYDEVDWHFEELRQRIGEQADFVRASLQAPLNTDEERIARFTEDVSQSVAAVVPDPTAVGRIQLAVPFDHCWMGLARYWRKREAVASRQG